ncbi:MAG: ATP-binding protein [Deltaproteobacteria bacterium]|nr:ATP-binding protein [Deltaproteobacteria bacterium]
MEEKPAGWILPVRLETPSLSDNTADADRLIKALETVTGGPVKIGLDILKKLPQALRDGSFCLKCVCIKASGICELVEILTPDDFKPAAGLAIDLGTTRVVMRLVCLESGRTLAESGFDNPQTAVGPDILARIHYTDTPNGLLKLNRLIIEGINSEIQAICTQSGIDTDRVFLATVSGNMTMAHLFCGIPCANIIREPYIPAVNTPGAFKASDLGLCLCDTARVFIVPGVGSYFGGDLISGAIFAGFGDIEDVAILVDVGTNAEVLIGNRDWLVACAGAAGPALEGGMSAIGMTAAPGAIDSVTIENGSGNIRIHTIGDGPAAGICGSGMIDLAAQLFLTGMVDIRGRIVPKACGKHFTESSGIAGVVVVPAEISATGSDLIISQVDLDSLIRSKAAMYTILETITDYVGIEFKDISTFFVAGTFGSFIRPESAIAIGMLPDLPKNRFTVLGNSSLGGASRMLRSREVLAQAEKIRGRITYLELNVNQDFMNRFSAAKFLPHTDPGRFPSISLVDTIP